MCNVKFKLLNKVIQGPLQYAPELSLNTKLILFEICCSLLANVFQQTQNALSFLLHPGITLHPQWPWCLACKWSLSQSLQAVGNISFWCPKYIGKFVLTPSITLLLILTQFWAPVGQKLFLPYQAWPVCQNGVSIKHLLNYFVNALKILEHRSRLHLENGHLPSTDVFYSCS